MKPIEGRLQTAEHVLSRTLESRLSDAKFIIAKFEENSGRLEIDTKEDLRKINKTAQQDDIYSVIKKNLQVSKHIINNEEAQKNLI